MLLSGRTVCTIAAIAAAAALLSVAACKAEMFAPVDLPLALSDDAATAWQDEDSAPAAAAAYPPVRFAAPGGCARVPYVRKAKGKEEKSLLQYLGRRAREFAQYLAATYPAHPRVAGLLEKFSGDVVFGDRPNAAIFHHQTGCVVLNPYTKSKTQLDTREDLTSRVLHMLAHTASLAHDPLFYETQRWFLRVASAELRWDVPVGCSACCTFKGACKDACPACRWTETCPVATC